MAPLPTYSGSLQPKKKAELQEIAERLGLVAEGTKDDLQARIKKHLDQNQDELEEHPVFGGLYGRKRRSSSRAPPSVTDEPIKPSRKTKPLDVLPEDIPLPSTPSDTVSSMLKGPFSTAGTSSAPILSAGRAVPDSPSAGRGKTLLNHSDDDSDPGSDVPNTISASAFNFASVHEASASALQRLTALIPRPASPSKMIQVVQPQADQVVAYAKEGRGVATTALGSAQTFLSDARTLWLLTSLVELSYIVYAVVPWQSYQITLPEDRAAFSLPYAHLHTFQTAAFWSVVGHWALPALVFPTIAGWLISFATQSTPKPSRGAESVASISNPGSPVLRARRAITPAGEPAEGELVRRSASPLALQNNVRDYAYGARADASVRAFDPLTAAIVRLAAEIAYPYADLEHKTVGIDVLGPRVRLLSASVGVALAFSEALAKRRA